MEIAVADFPLLGMRTKMIVSVLVASSSPARSVASSSSVSGLPWASVRLSMPTSSTSIAPSSPPSPSAAEVMWLIPDSNDRILPHATPVPTTIASATTRRWHGAGGRASAQATCETGAERVARIGVPDSMGHVARIVITGAGGMVGRVLADQARRQGRDVLALTSAQWDITDATARRAFRRVRRRGDQLRRLHQGGRRRGRGGPRARRQRRRPENVAHACARPVPRLIHISTDYVFSGDSTIPYEIDDETGPLSVYGRTKLAGELAVLAAMPDAHMVRPRGSTTAATAATSWRSCAGWPAGDGTGGCGGRPDRLAYVCRRSGRRAARGGRQAIREPVLHAANQGAVSRFEQAQAVFEEVGADPQRVRPVGTDRHPRPAPRPAYSALSGRQSAAAG